MASLRSDFRCAWHGVVSVLLCASALAGCGSDRGKTSADRDASVDPASAPDAGVDDDASVIQPRPDGTCEVVQHCLPPSDPCQQVTCVSNKCVPAPIASGSAASQQTRGDCVELRCDTQGKTVPWSDPSDVPEDDGQPCTEELCSGIMPVHRTLPVGSVLPAAGQTPGDCRELLCGEGNTVVSRAQPSDIPSTVSDICQEPACTGEQPASVPAEAGKLCGEIDVCDGKGECVNCRADHAPCSDDWQCCGGLCGTAGCTPTLCRPNERSCRDNKLVGCTADGQAENVLQDCGSTMHCDAELLSCQAGACKPGEPVCSGQRAHVCDAQGNLPASGGTDCAANGKSCESGVCIDKPVTTAEVIGGTTFFEDTMPGATLNLQGLRVTSPRTLTEFEAYLGLPADDITITFVVY
jgi:hypothetical protein